MPLLRIDTGCKCRKTLVSITTTRLRRSRGAGCRKMLFQTWELRMKSPTDIGGPTLRSVGVSPAHILAGGTPTLHLDERFRIAPLAAFLLKLLALIDHDLA